jgi:hypothetical protein
LAATGVDIALSVSVVAMGTRLVVVCSALAGLAAAAGCTIFDRPLRAPANDQATILLLTGGLGHPMDEIARHPWFATRRAGEDHWQIYEVGGGGSSTDPINNSPYVDPILHGVWRGAEAERGIACLEREAPKWIDELDYRFYPGPNSNTFGDVMLRRCDLHAGLPSTSVGKDWRGGFGITGTTEGTGFQVETPVLGFKLGLKEGFEIHIIGLSFGIDLWPPAIILPLGPGRLGFADR